MIITMINDKNNDDNNNDDDDDDNNNNIVILPLLGSSIPLQSFVLFFLIQRSLTVIRFQICMLGQSFVFRRHLLLLHCGKHR